MTDPIIAFLRARLDDDEQLARGAGGSWHERPKNWISTPSSGEEPDHRVALVLQANERTHIVRHDPARVLAEVEAKRRALTLHEAEPGQHPDFCGYDKHKLPCPALRLASLPYSDHPDYRDEWRPTAPVSAPE